MIPEEVAQIPVPDVAALKEFAPDAILGGRLEREQCALEIAPASILAVCEFLKVRLGYTFLADITAVDWHPAEPRFEVVYHMRCYERKQFLRLKCRLSGGDPQLSSVTSVWSSADWYEREVFDLFGIRFTGHPDLRRILLPDDWEGHPLQKTYPVTGYR